MKEHDNLLFIFFHRTKLRDGKAVSNMAVGIDNRYNSYYTQVSNNYISNTDKTTVSSISTTDKTTSKDDYFKNLCDKYSNLNLRMSDSHMNKENDLICNVSPELINKAISDPKAAEKIDYLLDQMASLPQYAQMLSHSLGGPEVKNISVRIDENGGCSCKIEIKQNDSKKTDKKSDEEKLLEKKKKELREKVKALKEAQEKHLKGTKDLKVCNYYNNVAQNCSKNLTVTDDDSMILNLSLDELVGMIQ